MEMQFRQLMDWPGERTPHHKRKRSSFSASYSKTLVDLDRELTHLKATNIVLQADVSHDQIRLDGQLRSGASPKSPGIILAFDSKFGPLSYACDTFTGWQDNLRAVCLTLDAQRRMDRYGASKRGEQYKGWTALPGPKPSGFGNKNAAAEYLAGLYGEGMDRNAILDDPNIASHAYREAMRLTHPDRGGDVEDFKRVQEAARLLGVA